MQISQATKDLRRELLAAFLNPPASLTDAAGPLTNSRLVTRVSRAERDPKHLNRYRLVIAADHPTQIVTDARTLFGSIAGYDNRAHLPILATYQLPVAFRFDVNDEARAI